MNKRIKNWLLKELICQVNAEDVFTYTPQGTLFFGGKQLTEGEIRSLQNEVKFLEETRIWKVYQETLANQARERMFNKAQSYEDMYSGKLLLKNLEVMRDINKIVKSWKPVQIKR
jgi:hypothetical protein